MPREMGVILFIKFTILLVSCCHGINGAKRSRAEWMIHKPLEIEAHDLTKICGKTDLKNMNEILDNILVHRVVGTDGHKSVQKYIKKTMEHLRWTIETDRFNDTTPNMGVLTFENIIATLNPNAQRHLLLACHYDSKYFPDGTVFLGATDSAVPCAMMINLATVLADYLDHNRQNDNISLKMVFFDGEEAFRTWTATDSIYGARHLAAKWEAEGVLPSIDMMILLDLLGVPDPNFFCFFDQTQPWYTRFTDIETRLAETGMMDKYTNSGIATTRSRNAYFQSESLKAGIEDDHIPFLQRGVPILHVIPVPFPSMWHKKGDNREAIDMMTVENLNKILRIFIMEYLHLQP